MVNIQIRGPLVHITVNQFAEHQMKDMITNKKNVSEFVYKNKKQTRTFIKLNLQFNNGNIKTKI